MKKVYVFDWILKIVISIILLQSLFFKFTGHEISKELFMLMGIEPWGRIFVGIVELIFAILILLPRFSFVGVVGSLVISAGAILTHLLIIGINFGGDISLFLLAIVIFVFSSIIIYLEKG